MKFLIGCYLPFYIYLLYLVSNTYWNTTSRDREMVLILDVSSLSCIPSLYQVNDVLADLTTMVLYVCIANSKVSIICKVSESLCKGLE